jgi:PAS domain S-box-containing protein
MPVSLGRYIETEQHKRQTRLKRLGILAGFALLLVLLLGNTFFVRHELGIQIENQAWVTHTRDVLFELEKAETLFEDVETGQRGFLYTGDPKYLEPYNLAVGQILPNIAEIALLTSDSPRQQARISELRSQAQAKLAEMAQTISMYKAGKPDDAKALVKSDAGKVAMDKIRDMIDDMELEEVSLEVSRTSALESSVRATIISVYLPSLLAALILVFLAYFILREMTHHEQYLHELRRREEWYRVTLTSIGDAVIATDEHGKVTFLNPVAETLTGTTLAEAIGKDIAQVFPIFNEVTEEVVENPVQRVIHEGRMVALANHTVLRRSNGIPVPIEDSAAPIRDDQDKLVGVVLVFRDTTIERNTRNVLYKTERLAAAARLSASVAHEINNPLAAVVNLIYLAKSEVGASPSVVQTLTTAEQELERVAHITRHTLGFYRDSSVPAPVQIPALIETVLKLYSNKLKNKNIAIARDFSECPPVLGMSGELRQVVSNLISNAVDAVGADGTITIRAESVDRLEGKCMHMVIEDDGPGIPAEDQDRIFEPFFTTKIDVGTGLGLWVSREIVERHGGTIQVGSRGDGLRGAAFEILLPCSSEVTAALQV